MRYGRSNGPFKMTSLLIMLKMALVHDLAEAQ